METTTWVIQIKDRGSWEDCDELGNEEHAKGMLKTLRVAAAGDFEYRLVRRATTRTVTTVDTLMDV